MMSVQKNRESKRPFRMMKSLAVMTMVLFLLAGCGNNTPGSVFQPDSRNAAPNNTAMSAENHGNQKQRITLEEARALALKHAGVSENDAVFTDRDFDLDDGIPLYELEFRADGMEYEYEVHAETGEIIKAEKEPDNRLRDR